MTAVEFYERPPIENVISSLTTVPDKIIFIGDGKMMKKFQPIYHSFLEARGLNIEIEYKNIKKHDLNNIIEVLSDIVEKEEQCVFDLTGGEDLVLVAMGIVYQKYLDKKVQMQRFNIRNGVVTDCDNDGTVLYSGVPEVTVEENIQLHGGVVRYEDDRTYRWDLSDDFVADIREMWALCRVDPGIWNKQLNVLAAIESFKAEPSLEVEADLMAVREYLKRKEVKHAPVGGLLRKLEKKGLIRCYTNDGATVSFTYKNEQVRKCLTKAGTVLELIVLVTANQVTDKNKKAVYTDSMSGVFIDWDGDLHDATDEKKDTENEIDVVLMKGLTPVFISCKNGSVSEDELYKLDAVSSRFGGQQVRKFLIATYLGKKPDSLAHFRQRATDMGITFIDRVHELSDERFERKIKHLLDS